MFWSPSEITSPVNNAVDGDCFYLPTTMHLHAFMLLKEQNFADKNFKVAIKQ